MTNIYTYKDKKTDPTILSFWKKNWRDHGFNPVVLSLEDAKKHPEFATKSEELIKIFTPIFRRDTELLPEDLEDWFMWLAFAGIGLNNEPEGLTPKSRFFFSNCNVFNDGFKPQYIYKNITFHLSKDHIVFGSGCSSDFQTLINAFVPLLRSSFMNLYIRDLYYYPSEMLIAEHGCKCTCRYMQKTYNITFLAHENTFIGGPNIEGFPDGKLCRDFSGRQLEQVQEDYEEYSDQNLDQLRISLLTNFLF